MNIDNSEPATQPNHPQNRLLYEQVKGIYKNPAFGLAANVINPLIASVVLWGNVSHVLLAGWTIAHWALTATRLISLRSYNPQDSSPAILAYRKNRMIAEVFASGCIWGSAAFLFYPSVPHELQVFVVFLLGGMTVAAISLYSVIIEAILAYLFTVMIPITVSAFIYGGEIAIAMGSLLAVFTLLQIFIARNFYRIYSESFLLLIKNETLLSQLENSEQKHKEAQRIASIGHWEYELGKNTISWSDEIYRILGVTAERLGNSLDSLLGIIHPEDRDFFRATYNNSIVNRTMFDIIFRTNPAGGEAKHIHALCDTRYDPAGNPIRSLGTFQDITPQREAEIALGQSEARLLAITTTVQEAIILTNGEGRIVFWNPAAEQMFGWTLGEMIGRQTITSIMPERYRARHYTAMARFYNSGEGAMIGKTTELTGLRKNGDEFPLELSLTAIRLKNEWHALGVLRDITERKQTEKKISHHIALLDSIGASLSMFIANMPQENLFDSLLEYLLKLTGSEYGFIGEVQRDDSGEPYLRTHSITNIAWNTETSDFYNKHAPKGMEFRKLDSLYGAVIKTGKPVISNNPGQDPRRGGLPAGHPQLKAFLGLPLMRGGELIGMAGLANRQGGYDESVVEYITPMLATCANIIEAKNLRIEKERVEKSLRKSREGLSRAQEIALLGNWEWDILQDSMYWSAELYRILGYEPKKFWPTYSDFIKRIHPEDVEFVKLSIIQAMFEGEVLSLDFRILLPDKSTKILHMHGEVSMYKSGEPERVFGTIQDITARKTTELALIKAKEEAEEATKLKDKFVSLVSHDLKGPLGIISGMLMLLKPESAGPQLQLIEKASETADNMMKLIDELLNLSRIRSGKIKPALAFVDARTVVHGACSMLEPLAEKKGVRLENMVPEKSRIYADPGLFTQVIQNLVSNAIKFSSKNDVISIKIPDGEKSVIAVSDTGRGIKPEAIKDLFNLTKKTSTTGTAGERGTGFGLPLSHEIMAALGGSLDVESAVGEGSVFFARLPYVKPVVLLVDDDHAMRLIMSHLLKDLSVTLIESGNGLEALNILEHNTVHIILTDISMPIMDGLQLIQKVKSNPNTAPIPIVAITSDHSVETREKVFQLGAGDFFEKPFNRDDVIPRIRRYIV